MTDAARALARGVLYPPMSAPAWPALAVLRLATIGLLPPSLREQYGFGWNARRDRALRISGALIRGVLPVVPPVIRHWPAARAAQRRAHAAV